MKQSPQRKKAKTKEKKDSNRKLLPLQFILCILPLVAIHYQASSGLAQYTWHSERDIYHDFFLHFKMILFIIAAVMMLALLIFEMKKESKEERKKLLFLFLPLLCYLFFAVISTIFSIDKGYSLLGGFEAKEPLPVILGYGITALYAFVNVKTKEDVIQLAKAAVAGAIMVAIIGLLQAVGSDPLVWEWVQKLIVDDSLLEQTGYFVAVFPKGMVYTTLFNPNYVGTYVALLFPIAFLSIFGEKKLWQRLVCVAASAALLVILLFSQSRTGMLAFAGSIVVLVLFGLRYVAKRWYLIVGGIAVLAGLFFFVNWRMDFLLTNRLKQMVAIEKTEYDLKGFDTTGNGVEVHYKDTVFTVGMEISQDGFSYTAVENQEQLEITYLENAVMAYFTLKNGEQMSIQTAIYEDRYAFGLLLEDTYYYFTNQMVLGDYKFINEFGRADECVYADNVLRGYETAASSRGYVWGETLPLLKKHILLGSGPDTFVLEFPQNDYVAKYRADASGIIYTRPHNLYLQMGVQTGVLSLIAFLVFYLRYFISSCRRYFFKKYNSVEEQMGFAMFLGTVGFMIASFANDSLIVVSPIFWVMLGTGMAINHHLCTGQTEKMRID